MDRQAPAPACCGVHVRGQASVTTTSWKTSSFLESQSQRCMSTCACMHCVSACACLQLTVRTRQRQREDRTQRPGCAAPPVISVRTFVSQRDFNEDLHFCVLCLSCCCPLAGLSLNMHVCFYVCSSASKYSVTLVLCTQTVCIYVCVHAAALRVGVHSP